MAETESPPVDVVGEFESVDPNPSVAPSRVAGFARMDTYRWRDSGTATFYSDGLLSFTLVATPDAFSLEESDASDVSLQSGTYRRLFEPGRVTYVWEAEVGGMALIGDLPLDLQEAVLAEIAPPDQPNVLTRFWRRLFR